MAGTITVDKIQSDTSYSSTVNVVSALVVSNTATFANTLGVTGGGLATATLQINAAQPNLTFNDTGGNGVGLSIRSGVQDTGSTTGNYTTFNIATGKAYSFAANNVSVAAISSSGISTTGTLSTTSTAVIGSSTNGQLQLNNAGGNNGASLWFSGASVASGNRNWVINYGDFAANTLVFAIATAAGGVIGSSGTEVLRLSGDGELTITCPTGNKYSLTPVNSHASNPFGIYNRFTGADPNSTGNSFLYCEGSTAGGTLRAGIRSNGGLANYSGNNVNLSDLEVKPFTQAFDSEKLWRFGKAMRPAWMQFKYDDQTHDDWNNGYGAQLVQEAAGTDFPELVSLGNWGTNDEPKMRLEVYDNDLIHIMCAITTESQFKIDALEARLAALEAK